jgi:hypothetical protein
MCCKNTTCGKETEIGHKFIALERVMTHKYQQEEEWMFIRIVSSSIPSEFSIRVVDWILFSPFRAIPLIMARWAA